MKRFLSKQEIDSICCRVAIDIHNQIRKPGSYEKKILFICTLKGADLFFNRVMNYLQVEDHSLLYKIQVEYIQPRSYVNNQQGKIKLNNFEFDYSDHQIFIFEDILDSYKTLERILKKFVIVTRDCEITVVTLLAKNRSNHNVSYTYRTTAGRKVPQFIIGRHIPEDTGFLYGFGLDDDGKGRLLPYICIK